MSVKTPSQPGTNRITFGPAARRLVRAVARFVNPLTLVIAGRRFMPIVGIVRHTGVKTGRLYATPLGVRPLGDGFVMPLTFSESARWYRNTVAAGRCGIKYLGFEHTMFRPEIISGPAGARAFPAYERFLFRLIGIDEYLWVHKESN